MAIFFEEKLKRDLVGNIHLVNSDDLTGLGGFRAPEKSHITVGDIGIFHAAVSHLTGKISWDAFWWLDEGFGNIVG